MKKLIRVTSGSEIWALFSYFILYYNTQPDQVVQWIYCCEKLMI